MSSLYHHDNIRSVGDVAPEPQATDHPSTYVDTADPTKQTTNNKQPSSTIQIHGDQSGFVFGG
jgi:hypothetical protein